MIDISIDMSLSYMSLKKQTGRNDKPIEGKLVYVRVWVTTDFCANATQRSDRKKHHLANACSTHVGNGGIHETFSSVNIKDFVGEPDVDGNIIYFRELGYGKRNRSQVAGWGSVTRCTCILEMFVSSLGWNIGFPGLSLFCRFPQSLQANAGTVSRLGQGQGHFIANPRSFTSMMRRYTLHTLTASRNKPHDKIYSNSGLL
jgi:hypothetical protein